MEDTVSLSDLCYLGTTCSLWVMEEKLSCKPTRYFVGNDGRSDIYRNEAHCVAILFNRNTLKHKKVEWCEIDFSPTRILNQADVREGSSSFVEIRQWGEVCVE